MSRAMLGPASNNRKQVWVQGGHGLPRSRAPYSAFPKNKEARIPKGCPDGWTHAGEAYARAGLSTHQGWEKTNL